MPTNFFTADGPGIPSVKGSAVKPHMIMTLALPKFGLSNANCGTIMLADIGIPLAIYTAMKINYRSPFRSQYVVSVKEQESIA